METAALAGAKKNAARRGQTIVFIDESGLTERPHRCRTWSPKGQTPVLQYHFHWKMLSAIAGVTWWTFYFRLYPGTIRSPQVIDFLRRLLRQIPGDLLVIWDGLRQHRRRNSIPSSTSGAIGNDTSFPTSAHGTSVSSATMRVARCAACNVGPISSLHSGNKRDCSDVTMLRKSQ